jgi:integrase
VRGDGSAYERGKRWWIAYYVNGKLHREPAGKTKKSATDKLKAVHKALRAGTYLEPEQRQVTVNELLNEMLTQAENNGLKSARKLRSHLQAVRRAFGERRALEITTAMLARYWKDRTEAGRKPATVARELEALRRAFNYAAGQKPARFPKHEIPTFEIPKTRNARQGFLTRADFEAIVAHLEDEDVRDFVLWFYWTGMRPNEIRQLEWSMLNRENVWTLTLAAVAAKTGEGRVLAVVGPLREIIERRLRARRLDCRLIFHRMSRGKPGQPVKDIRLRWAAACKAAGLIAGRKVDGGVTPYDLRRCAVRNLIRSGTHETVAMKITGHKTRSTFDRYNIASLEDISAAIEKTTVYVGTLPTERKVETLEHSQNMHNPAARPRRRVSRR